MILALDTSADRCAVALVDEARVGDHVWQRAEAMTRGHSDALFPMIDAVMADAGARTGDLTRIAVCTGPGSFTGVRAGVAAARGLALGLDVPAIGITRLQALAAAAGRAGTVALALPGGAVAVQSFDGGGQPVGAAELRAAMPDGDDLLAVEAPGRADPVVLARLAAGVRDAARPAPFYMRSADALASSDLPPAILDP